MYRQYRTQQCILFPGVTIWTFQPSFLFTVQLEQSNSSITGTLEGPSCFKGLCSGDLLIWQSRLLSFYILNFFDSSHSVGIASRRGLGSGFNKETKEFKIDHLMSYLDCLEDWKQFISESDLVCRGPLTLTKLSALAKSKVTPGQGEWS